MLATSQKHGVRPVEKFSTRIFEKKLYSDILLFGCNKSSHNAQPHLANKCFLASSSPFFEALLGGKWADSNESTYTLDYIEHVLEFIYTGRITMNEADYLAIIERLEKVSMANQYLLIHDLVVICEKTRSHPRYGRCATIYYISCSSFAHARKSVAAQKFS